MDMPTSSPSDATLSLPLPAGRLSEENVLYHFRRLRGPVDELRSGSRQPLRDYLVLVHSTLVEHCARTFLSSGEPLEDLLQEGTIGLIKAVDRFDPEKGVRFSTYACHLISGEMRHYLRDLGKLIHEPGWHAELRLQINRASDDLTQKLGRAPQAEEVASALDMQAPVVRRVLDSGNVLAVTSLDAESDDENGGSTKTQSYDETDPSLEPLSTSVENRMTLNAALPQLRDLEQRAVTLFYYGEHSKTEIARQMGISVNYAAYLVKRGVEHLRRIIESEVPVQTASPTLPLPLAWSDLTRWIEDNTQRDGAPREFALLLCRIQNWDQAAARLTPDARHDAEQGAGAVARRSCRKADKVVALTGTPFGGLSFLALMPNTGAVGQRAGGRWQRACDATSVYPTGAGALGELQIEYSFVYSEGDHRGEEPSADPEAWEALHELLQDILSRRPTNFVAAAGVAAPVGHDAEGAQETALPQITDTHGDNALPLAADGVDAPPHIL